MASLLLRKRRSVLGYAEFGVNTFMYRLGQYTYQMGYTLVEFNQALAGDFSRKTHDFTCTPIDSNHWQVLFDGSPFALTISLEQAPPRIIALLQLPVLNVCFDCVGEPDAEIERQFFTRFFRYFHKGGG